MTQRKIGKIVLCCLESSKPVCVCCQCDDAVYVCTPCGHFCICEACKKLLPEKKCPVCRADIITLVRVWT